jgi:glycosyltransferase involved in cell wall biosynthesis
METRPLVSVVCLCYNQQDFVIEAIQSVIHQTYSPIEIIVVDDASSDNSARIINEFCSVHPSIRFLDLKINVGNCKAFNQALMLANGKFVIDLAADDILLPERVEEGVNLLLRQGDAYGVHFSDAEYIDANGKHLGLHSDSVSDENVPQGDVYEELISRYFVCAPTVMCRKLVMDALGGYDESLAFEDFDFWIRSSRLYKYCYSNAILVKKRILTRSKSQLQYKWRSPQMRSIFIVCTKIFNMNKSLPEMQALKKRIYYEMRKAAVTGNIRLVFDYFTLLKKTNHQISRGIFPREFR